MAAAAVASKVSGTVAGQPEDERSEHVDAVSAENLQPLDQVLAREIEILVDIFQSGRGHSFDSDQSALDARRFHGIQKVSVFGGFHGDLGKENHVIGELGQARHEFKPLGAQGFEFSHAGGVLLQPGQVQVGEGDRDRNCHRRER